MTSERIKEIQEETAYPNSVSVQQALLKVWNECEQEANEKLEEFATEFVEHFDYRGSEIKTYLERFKETK